MPITSISRDLPNNVSIVRITCTDTLATIATANYILNQTPIITELNKGIWQWFDSDTLLFDSSDGNAFFQFTDDTFTSLVLIASSTDGTVSPGLINQVGIYATSGTVISGSNNLPSLVQVSTGSLNSGTNASATTFWRGDGSWRTIASSTSHSTYAVYVSPDGSNTTGNGSINAPYQTIAHALTTITNNDSTHYFNIILPAGIYNETVQIKLKPFVNLVSYSPGTIINNSLAIILDTEWDTTTNGFCSIENVTINNDLTLNFVSVPSSDSPIIRIINCVCSGITNLQGNSTNQCIFWIYSSFFLEMTQNNALIESFSNYYLSIFSSGTTAFIAPHFLFSNNDYFNAGASLTGDTSGGILQEYNIRNSKVSLPLTITGVNATLNIDVASYVSPTIIGSATVNLLSIANGLDAIYTPTNYTPDATGGTNPVNSVAAHLHGIDNALGAETMTWTEVTGTSQAASVNNAYVTNNGGLVTVTLPATAILGDRIAIQGKGAGGWSMVANTGQSIIVGNVTSSVAGSVSSTHRSDAIEIVCITNDTTWATRFVVGNMNIL